MNLFTLEQLLISICCIGLAIFIAKYAETKAHRLWAVFNCVVASWSIGSVAVGLSSSAEEAHIYWKYAIASSVFISIVFHHFVCAYCQIQRARLIRLSYLHATLFASTILFTDKMIPSITLMPYHVYYFQVAPLFYIWFGIWLMVLTTAFYELWQYFKIAPDAHKNQTAFIFWAMLIGFTGGTSTILPGLGVPIYPYWQISICLYTFICTYAIFKHRLLPINDVIRKSIVYSLIATIILLIYLVSIALSQELLNQYMGYSGTILTFLIIALIFIPLKNKIQLLVDKIFLRASPIEIAEQNEQLRHEVAQTEKFKAISTLASSLAHEIKNPLTLIKTFSEVLPERKNDPAFLGQYEKLLASEVNRIDSLVQELLSFAKPSEPKLASVKINNLIEDLIKLISPQAQKHNTNIQTNLCPENPCISADESQLKQALLNIFLNAIDAMPNGGKLVIATTVIPAKAGIQITITDTGHGIDPKDLPHIFEPFYTKKEKGTGLGLAITQGIIEKHGGKITVKSKLKEGTVFTITL